MYHVALAVNELPRVEVARTATGRKGISALVIELNRVLEYVRALFGVGDRELLCNATESSFRRDAASVLDDSPQATVRIAGANDDAMGELMFGTEHVLIFISEPRTRVNVFEAL